MFLRIVLHVYYHGTMDNDNAFKVGARVSCRAKQFGIAWARANYQSRWKTARVHGVVREILGPRSYKVMYDGDPEPLESAESTLKKSRKRKLHDSAVADDDAVVPEPAAAASGRCKRAS